MFNANNPFAFPKGSFNQRVTPPTVDPDEGTQLSVCFAEEWQAVVLGALDQLKLPATWDSNDPAVVQLAIDRAELLKEIFSEPACPTRGIDTPYWDDDTDVDDQQPADMQPWYGEVTNPTAPPGELDFVENAAIWFFTGLIALGTAELAFAPAILFHTIAPRFVIAMKRGDIGEIFRIVIDGQDQARVDTTPYAPGEIINVPLIPADADSHDLLIIGGIAP